MNSMFLLSLSASMLAVSSAAIAANEACTKKEAGVEGAIREIAPGIRTQDILSCEGPNAKYVPTTCNVLVGDTGKTVAEAIPKGKNSKQIFGGTDEVPEKLGVLCHVTSGSQLQIGMLPKSYDACTYDTADQVRDTRRTVSPGKDIFVDEEANVAVVSMALIRCHSNGKPQVVRCLVFKGTMQDRQKIFTGFIYDKSKRVENLAWGKTSVNTYGPQNKRLKCDGKDGTIRVE